MGQQIIRQPNGKWALWSSIVSDFLMVDATEQDIVDYHVEYYTREMRFAVAAKIIALEKGEPAYHQFSKSWQEALSCMQEIHGQDHVDEFLREVGDERQASTGSCEDCNPET